jgi:hypothetical protein
MEEEGGKSNKLDEIHNTLKIVMKKLDKFDVIEGRMKTLEEDLRDVKTSMEYAHAQITDLKTSHEIITTFNKETKDRLDKLEKENADLHNGIIDLKAWSMRDNLIFYNLPEIEHENTTKMIHQLLEDKLGMKDVKVQVKIDRSHRLGRKREGNSKLRPIVAKFNYHQDKEFIRRNANKLKGTKIGISEQFQDKIARVRQALYLELKKAKAEGKRARIVKDKLIIEGIVFNTTRPT